MSGNIASAADLRTLHCAHATVQLDAGEAAALAALLDGWTIEGGRLVRRFGFANYYETMAFVNALAYIAHNEDHHPELVVGYKTCEVRYDTHSVKGLSLNDFICAAKADALLRP
ncbi:4a-hydroxytetrahydrobiopterin dehydratase [Massilia endophytica]|uniref:4a-hydroxytetrahydrobiopterin dehydratase n=1 Tax=Massilia endophytica TaxID=2899220 RepID=UPI001E4B25CF|nr:4a-hydroxytetrahydrobiopterin dehydratase [Massilia endophytica]UGQ47751.1 4a-hydroxytetrahydrobiopterin dehydratase [Massilia endophytica]